MAVIATAISMGKNSTKAGVRIVPTPKPEKKVKMEVKKATPPTIKKSIILNRVKYP